MTTRQKLLRILMGVGLTIVFYSPNAFAQAPAPEGATKTIPPLTGEQKKAVNAWISALTARGMTPEQARHLVLSPDCSFNREFLLAQEQRRLNATAVIYSFPPAPVGSFEDYPFLKKDFSGEEIRIARNWSSAGGVNLLFVINCTLQGCFEHIYVNSDGGPSGAYKKAIFVDNSSGRTFVLPPTDKIPLGVGVTGVWRGDAIRAKSDGQVSLFYTTSDGGRINPSSSSQEYTLIGNATFKVTELHEGC
jgi:hypothetical protein